MPLETVYLLEGDILLTRSPSPLSRAIRWSEQSPGEGESHASHCGIVVRAGYTEEAVVVEALDKVRRHTIGKAYGGRPDELKVIRFTDLTEPQRTRVAIEAEKLVGRLYSWLTIGAHGVDRVLSWATRWLGKPDPVVARRLVPLTPLLICSRVVGIAYWKGVGRRLHGHTPESLQPDDIDDMSYTHPDVYRVRDWAPLAKPE